MSTNDSTPQMLTARKVFVNLVGFTVGVGLFVWILYRGFFAHGEDVTPEELTARWTQLIDRPWLIVALLGCTACSALLNASTFWITVKPLRQLKWVDMQLLNLVANMLNYAPLRLGALARVAYHVRVDGMTLLQIGAWFTLIGIALLMGVGACLVATFVHSELDFIWIGLVLGQMLLGGVMLRFMADQPIIDRVTRGLNRLIVDPRSLWGAIVFRVLDLGAFSARMAVAAAILKLTLPPTQVVVLAVIALAASLVPFGRFGFREACVAFAASKLAIGRDDVESVTAQLALVESMGEALFFIPLGGLAGFWFLKRWRAVRATPPAVEPGTE